MYKKPHRPVSLPSYITPPSIAKKIAELKDFPFTAENFLKGVDEAAKRTRRLLLILIFTSIIILMALVNSLSPEYSWFSSKEQLFEDVSQHVYFENSNKKSIKFEELVLKNEAHFKTIENPSYEQYLELDTLLKRYKPFEKVLLVDLSYAPIYWENSFIERVKIYDRLGKAIQYVYINNIIDKQVIDSYTDKLYEADVEHIELIRVPILGVTFHVNFLGVFSGLTLIVLYSLLYFSLKREHINTKIAFRRGWRNAESYHHHYYYYEYLSMFQILHNPKKLFVKNKEGIIRRILNRIFGNLIGNLNGNTFFSYAAIFLPLIVHGSLVYYDYCTSGIGHEINDNLTYFTVYSGIFLWTLLLMLSRLVFLFWKKMDRVWEYHALEFNFECILEKSGIDTNIDFYEYSTCSLTTKDGHKVKAFWYNTLKEFFPKHNDLNVKNCFKMYLSFLNQLLENDGINSEKASSIASDKEIEIYWNGLYCWYLTFGKRAVSSVFRQEFVNMIASLKEVYKTQNSATVTPIEPLTNPVI